jgi:hypothetical protein
VRAARAASLFDLAFERLFRIGAPHGARVSGPDDQSWWRDQPGMRETCALWSAR